MSGRPIGRLVPFATLLYCVLGLFCGVGVMRGPLTTYLDVVGLFLVVLGGLLVSLLSAPFGVHRVAWRTAVAEGPISEDEARPAREALGIQVRSVLTVSVLAALMGLADVLERGGGPAWRSFAWNGVLPLLYGGGLVGLVLWPLQASLARRTGATPAQLAAPRLPRWLVRTVGVWFVLMCLLGAAFGWFAGEFFQPVHVPSGETPPAEQP